MHSFPRMQFDADAYVKSVQDGPCFVCAVATGKTGDHEVFHDDGRTIAFLNKYPTLPGYSLVCPKRHAEDLADDLTEAEYLAVQSVVRSVARAMKRVVPTERVYVMSLGSMSGNSHIHWHVAPLPPGVPYEQQQFHAVMTETSGVLDVDSDTRTRLAARLRESIEADRLGRQ
ncbi:MAG: HIT family protein [Stackebrandtia sp.]